MTVAFGCTFVHVHSLFRSCSFLFCIFHPFHFSILVFFLALFSAFPMPTCISCTVRNPIDKTVTLGMLSLVILSPFSFLPGLDECSFRGSFLSCCSHSWCFYVLNKWNQQSRQCVRMLNVEHRVSPEACGPHSPIQGALKNQRGNTLVVCCRGDSNYWPFSAFPTTWKGCSCSGVGQPSFPRVLMENVLNPCHLVCILGGGSALLPAPIPPILLEEKEKLTKMLASRGAAIQELNIVRKTLSLLKGGGLARLAYPAQVTGASLCLCRDHPCAFKQWVNQVPGRFSSLSEQCMCGVLELCLRFH